MGERVDIAVIGASAAGLMASIAAAREGRASGSPVRVVAFDGAKQLGVKILVAGGGRCNVTHHRVTHADYAGGSKNAVRSVLRRFGVDDTVAFFGELGIEFKQEETGKLFPTTDDARTVLDALLGAARDAGVELRFPDRVLRVARTGEAYVIESEHGEVVASRVVLAMGGKALPRSGSDGQGYSIAESLGHTITRRVFPALVPIKLGEGSVLRELKGIAVRARLELRAGSGKRLHAFTDDTLCTHFGLSGPAPMNVSRYLTDALHGDPGAHLVAAWLPDVSREDVDDELRGLGKRSVGRWLRGRVPERLADALCGVAGVDAGTTGGALTKVQRRSVVEAVCGMRLDVTGDRGFTHAETTAGGVPLGEIAVSSMVSRHDDRLYLCGELCDVDGRIGGFNFQWAWATGHIAGTSAARSLAGAASV